jgi:type I restriction enzyme S subunit
MSDWKKYKLGEIAEINPRVPIRIGEEYSFVEMKDLNPAFKYVSPSIKKEFKSGTKFQNGDTLFARITPCLENGKICQVRGLENNLGFGSSEFIIFRGREGLSDIDFIYYLTRTDEVRNFAIQAMTGSSGRQRVEKSVLEKLDVNVPNLIQQNSISKFLSALDEKIDVNQKINRTLENIAQTIFEEWFVNYNFPDFDGNLENNLPIGWRIGALGEITINFDSKRIPLSNRERLEKKGNIPYYGAASIVDYINEFIFEGTYLLMGEDGTIATSEGYPVLQYVWGQFWVNNHAHVLQGRNPFSTEYIYLLLLKTKITNIITGAVQPKITQGNLNRISCVIPAENVLKDFYIIISPIFERIKNLAEESKTLISLRDSLLPKLMSGKLQINQ